VDRWLRRGRLGAAAALAGGTLLVGLLAGCAGWASGGRAAGEAAATGAGTAPSAPSVATSSSAATGSRPDTLVAVTTTGAVVVLDPTDGHEVRRLVASGASGRAVQLTPDGRTVYYEKATGCRDQLWRVPVVGGVPALVTDGSVPAVSRDGTRLAYASQMLLDRSSACGDLSTVNVAAGSKVVVRDLAGGRVTSYLVPPDVAASGLPAPIGRLSWSVDGSRLAISVPSVQDNEGWALHELRLGQDKYYLPGSRAGSVPLGRGVRANSYYEEGVYLPDGNMFVARACCEGIPESPSASVDMVIIDPASGATVKKVAIGRVDHTHTSLDADTTGRWLLYLSGTDLLVSQGGAKPVTLGTGAFVAADW